MNIEEFETLLKYLRRNEHVRPDEIPGLESLPGGVSNRTVLVRRNGGSDFVVKQALEKLRVAVDWHSDPARSQREALGLEWLTRLAPEGAIPKLLFQDRADHLFGMHAVPEPHANWKSLLLAGEIDLNLFFQFGSLLGAIHRRATEMEARIAPAFEDRTFFRTLRLEPYYEYSASQNAEAASFMRELMAETERVRESLVHGDYSPKNILVHQRRLVLLDHEVIHWGDPAFDLGFSISHFISKANHLAACRDSLIHAASAYWKAYQNERGEPSRWCGLEHRTVKHTLGCLLARVDGRSPLEYLTGPERRRQRAMVLELIKRVPKSIDELLDEIDSGLGNAP